MLSLGACESNCSSFGSSSRASKRRILCRAGMQRPPPPSPKAGPLMSRPRCQASSLSMHPELLQGYEATWGLGHALMPTLAPAVLGCPRTQRDCNRPEPRTRFRMLLDHEVDKLSRAKHAANLEPLGPRSRQAWRWSAPLWALGTAAGPGRGADLEDLPGQVSTLQIRGLQPKHTRSAGWPRVLRPRIWDAPELRVRTGPAPWSFEAPPTPAPKP